MRGGRLKISDSVIKDLGSREQSSYKELPTNQKVKEEGLQTGEEYLLETERDFPKSFLAKFIRLSFNSDNTVGIVSYRTYNDYLQDSLKGMGLFEKNPCK